MTEEVKKHPLLLLSGGLDSSYMLLKQLELGDVHTCYIDNGQHRDKVPVELAARKKVIAYAEQATGNRVLSDTIVEVDARTPIKTTDKEGHSRTQYRHIPDVAWGQPFGWLYGLMFVVDGRIHSEVNIGYLMNDQISQRFENIRSAWDQTVYFTKVTPIEMKFPLSLHTKNQVFDRMPKELMKDLWICDAPWVKDDGLTHPCGECTSCDTIRTTIWLWEFKNSRNFREVVEKAVVNHEEKLAARKRADEMFREKLEEDHLNRIKSGELSKDQVPYPNVLKLAA